MNHINQYLESRLQQRQQNGTLRQLKPEQPLVDFCSNDYLGFARSAALQSSIDEELQLFATSHGSTGSRLLAGNSNYVIALENFLAEFYNAEAALLFNSGYDANVGLFSALPQRGDTVLHDELIHASIIDGIRLSYAQRQSFRHNDLQHLEEKLKKHTSGRCYVAVESIYSMDGDTAPLRELVLLCEQYQAALIVDEAHATGVFGNGIVATLGLSHRVLARVVTFGKALGCHGAAVVGSTALIDYLVNFARSFIYTTAAPLHQLAAIKMTHQLLKGSDHEVQVLKDHIHLFTTNLQHLPSNYKLVMSQSPIQCIVIGDVEKTKTLAAYLQQQSFDVRPILSPTVAAGTERLRICLHAFNTSQEISRLTQLINKYSYEQ
ncbi:aminotransferase class I/II-fold pyridoxal phosphate-dependent enzyme [Mucilaginibacter koreensis]